MELNMNKLFFIMMLLCSCSKSTNRSNNSMDSEFTMKENDKISYNKNSLYYKDFDLLNFKGVEILEPSELSYPYVEIQTRSNTVALIFALDENHNFKETYMKEDDLIYKRDSSYESGYKELRYMYIKNKRIYRICLLDDEKAKNPKSELQLISYSVSDSNKRIFQVLPIYDAPIFKYKVDPARLDINVPHEYLYSETIEEFKWNKSILTVTTKATRFIKDQKDYVSTESNCYDLKGLSFSWYYYWGGSFKIKCRQ